MKVLLLNIFRSPRALGGYYAGAWAPMPPITLACLAGMLERAGIDYEVHEEAEHGGDAAQLEAALRRARPDVVALSLVTATAPELPRIAAAVRRASPQARIVAGNIHAQVFHEDLLRGRLVDFVAHGEGEHTLAELTAELARAAPDPAKVAGLSFLRDGQVVVTPPRTPVEDLDSLPFPSWDRFPRERYRLLGFARIRDPGWLVLGSRGCPYRCTYCSLAAMTSRRRRRSAANLVDELEQLHERMGIVQPSFVDPIFPLERREGFEFAAEMIRRGLHRKQIWITETRTDRIDYELAQALREAGLRRIMFGIEAGDPATLQQLRKGATVDDAVRAVRDCRRAGVETVGFFILGAPGATRASMLRDMEYARRLDLDFAKFTVFVPYPGTPVWEQLRAEGRLAEATDWARYTSYPTKENPPVYLPDGVSASELVGLHTRAHLQFYLRPRMVRRHLFEIRSLGPREIASGLASLAKAVAGSAAARLLPRENA